MAYVQPNSVIQFFKGINLDNRYLHTIYFASESAQNTWFSGKVAKSIQGHSYQRYTVNQIKVKGDATEFLDLSYMRFKNDRGVDMWFYAFINSVEYINENNVLISYEIDVMQTWFIQRGSIRPCMVRREHVSDDTFGINLEDEPVGSEVYDFNLITQSNHFNSYSVVVSSSEKPAGEFLYGMYCGTRTLVASCDDQSGADVVTNFIESALGSWDKRQQSADIVDLYTFPSDFAGDYYPFTNPMYDVHVTHPSDFNGYTPKNKKMYSYPYAYIYATTMNGDNAMYKWEYWAGNDIGTDAIFGLIGTPLGGGMVECYPMDYNGVEENYDQALVISNFPKNSANIDAYQAWVASGGQTRLKNAEYVTGVKTDAAMVKGVSQAMTNVIDGAVGLNKASRQTSANGALEIAGTVNNWIQTGANLAELDASIYEAKNKIAYQWNDASYRPNVVVGTQTPSIACSYRTLDFYFFHAHVRNDEAKRIDDFFSMYGYAINRVKTPNLHSRQYWNFVQTENCVIAGDMPSSSKEAIARIFDGGITLWHNGDNVGNYRLSVTNDTINNPII